LFFVFSASSRDDKFTRRSDFVDATATRSRSIGGEIEGLRKFLSSHRSSTSGRKSTPKGDGGEREEGKD
jgi:hypothetical protein